jgi:hypothetical protein
MKKLYFLLLPILMYSCSGVEQYRAGIENLVTDWDSTTTRVVDLTSALAGDMAMFSQMGSKMNLTEDVLSKLKPEQVIEWQAVRSAFGQAMNGFASIRTEMGEFSKAWGEKANEVKALKDGLGSGKLEGDITRQISGLTTLVTQAKESLSQWQTAYASAKAQAETAGSALKSTFESLNASVTNG